MNSCTVDSALQSMPALPMYMCFLSTTQKEESSCPFVRVVMFR